VLVLEPDEEIRDLVRRVLVRLGHEALAPAELPAGRLPTLDAVILEPAWAPALAFALKLHTQKPKLPFLFASLELPGVETIEIRPRRRLVKPFSLGDLEAAIRAVLPP
jgi:DNA-binding response OmpR family regulator